MGQITVDTRTDAIKRSNNTFSTVNEKHEKDPR